MKIDELVQKMKSREIKDGTVMKMYYEGSIPHFVMCCGNHIDYYDKVNKKREKSIEQYIFFSDKYTFEPTEKELEEIEIQENRIVRYDKDTFIESMFNHFYDMDLEVRKKLNEAIKEIKKLKKEGK